MTAIDCTCAISSRRGDWYCNPGWSADEERSSEESPQPGDVKRLQSSNPEAMEVEKSGSSPEG
ncbi:MAG: hypothetical protein GVY07_12140 [Bacteroidetes bacterium]|nr:hypothetical protein [Bacteroidota bacterium]